MAIFFGCQWGVCVCRNWVWIFLRFPICFEEKNIFSAGFKCHLPSNWHLTSGCLIQCFERKIEHFREKLTRSGQYRVPRQYLEFSTQLLKSELTRVGTTGTGLESSTGLLLYSKSTASIESPEHMHESGDFVRKRKFAWKRILRLMPRIIRWAGLSNKKSFVSGKLSVRLEMQCTHVIFCWFADLWMV